MDNLAQQVDEIDALKNIYLEAFEELDVAASPKTFQIHVFPFTSETKEDVNYVGTIIKFSIPERYPDDLPEIAVFNKKGLTTKQCDELSASLLENANNYIGSVMIYSLLTIAQDWLMEQNVAAQQATLAKDDDNVDSKKKNLLGLTRFVTDKEAALLKSNSAIGQGTPVTKENFVEWKIKYDAELKLERELKQKQNPSKKWPGDTTGKEIFEKKAIKGLNILINATSSTTDTGDDEEDVEFDEQLFLDDSPATTTTTLLQDSEEAEK